MKETDYKKILKLVLPIAAALLSVFVLSGIFTSSDFHASSMASLDEKKATVMELTASSTAASAALTLLPGDAATPIAEKLADLSSYFLIVICAIYIEKYLLTITGYITFTFLIPAACVIWSVNTVLKRERWNYIAKKLAVFGAAIVLVVPVSLQISDLIEQTYESSIEETIVSAENATEEIENSAKEDEDGVLEGIWSAIKGGVSGAIDHVETILNSFIEALAVMIVTSCVIPVLVLFFFVWLIKVFLGVDGNLPLQIKPKRLK